MFEIGLQSIKDYGDYADWADVFYCSVDAQKAETSICDLKGLTVQLILSGRYGFYLLVTKTIYGMIVDHAYGLHKGVDNGGADKAESSFF